MRDLVRFTLLLAALAYADTAAATIITAMDTTGLPYGGPSDEVTIDVILDTEGVAIVGYQFHVAYDPAVLSLIDAVQTPPPGFNYYRTNPDPPHGLIAEGVNWGGGAPINQVVLSAVFHSSIPTSVVAAVTPTLVDYGTYDNILVVGYTTQVLDEIELIGFEIHMPEPTTGLLMVCGFVGLTMLGRRRRGA